MLHVERKCMAGLSPTRTYYASSRHSQCWSLFLVDRRRNETIQKFFSVWNKPGIRNQEETSNKVKEYSKQQPRWYKRRRNKFVSCKKNELRMAHLIRVAVYSSAKLVHVQMSSKRHSVGIYGRSRTRLRESFGIWQGGNPRSVTRSLLKETLGRVGNRKNRGRLC